MEITQIKKEFNHFIDTLHGQRANHIPTGPQQAKTPYLLLCIDFGHVVMSVCEIHAKAVKRKFNLKGLVNTTFICFIMLLILLSWQLAFLGSLKFWVVSQTENAVEKMLPFHSCLYGMSG